MRDTHTHTQHAPTAPHPTNSYYTGNYDTFRKTVAENEVVQLKKFLKEQDDIKHIKEFIASCGTYSNLVKQVCVVCAVCVLCVLCVCAPCCWGLSPCCWGRAHHAAPPHPPNNTPRAHARTTPHRRRHTPTGQEQAKDPGQDVRGRAHAGPAPGKGVSDEWER